MTRTPVTRFVLAVAAVALLAACGVPSESKPRVVSESDRLPFDSGPAPQPGDERSPKVYFLTEAGGTERLQSASRDVPANPTAVLNELLKGVTAQEQTRRMRTSIPQGTRLLGVSQQGRLLVVDLSPEFFQGAGEAQIEAVAQVVLSARGLDNVDRVQIVVAGSPREWPRGDGTLTSEPLTEFAYPELAPTSQPDFPPPPSPAAA
ncbi:MAG TPA: GerMN domain-containing protein [Acidimicrobiales bacterium]